MKNFVFISPDFPDHFYKFVLALKRNGMRVLGVGGNYRNNVSPILLNALDEYYELPWLDNFDLEVNALRYLKTNMAILIILKVITNIGFKKTLN